MASARQIRQIIAELATGGTTVFLTTHYIEEAERLCGRGAFIVGGRIVQVDTVKNLLRQADGRHAVQLTISGNAAETCIALKSRFAELHCDAQSATSILVKSSEPVRVGVLVPFVEDHGAEVIEARQILPSLEDCFVRITGIEASKMKSELNAAGRGGGA